MRPLRILFLLLVAGTAQAQPTATVRVRLFGTGTPNAVTVSGPGSVVVDGRPVGRLLGEARLERGGAGVRLSGSVQAEGMHVEITPDAGTLHVVGGRTVVDVRGRLVADAQGGALVVVNHVPMPDYVASVVASEYGFPEIEGVKAQAVLARTYAVRAAQTAASRLYDLDDHQGSQVYRGAGVVTETTRRAVAETRGQILTYAGAPAEALYSSSSGGHTASNESLWGSTPVPYLRGVPDPYDDAAPDHAWRTTADAGRMLGVLSRRYGGTVTGVEIAERSREGRAVRLRLIGSTVPVVSGADFRTAVNSALGWRTVRSTLFTLSREGGQYVFTGGGFGHGVGMSQYGARAQARAGRTYRDILAFYFQGTDLVGGDALPNYASDRPAPRAPAVAASGVALPTSAPVYAPSAPRAAPPSATAGGWPASGASPRPAPPRASAPVPPSPSTVAPSARRGW